MTQRATFRNERDITLVCGVSTSGKSYWTARHLIDNYSCYIVISPVEGVRGEYFGLYANSTQALLEKIDQYDEQNKASWRLKISDISDFDALCEILIERGHERKQRLCICIEEAQRVIPDGKKLSEPFKDIVFRGGDSHIDLVVVSQRAANIHLALRSQWLRIVSFRQSAPADVRWLYQSTGYEECLELPTFKPREYLNITPSRISHFYPK